MINEYMERTPAQIAAQFKKGEVNNPNGRPKASITQKELREALKMHVPEAVETILTVMRTAKFGSDRLKSAIFLIERVYGRATEFVEVSGQVELAVQRPESLSRDRWIQLHSNRGITTTQEDNGTKRITDTADND